MDPVFHFFISFAGGYIILAELYKKVNWRDLLVLSFLSVVIEVDHLLPVRVHVLHNIFTLLIVVAISLFLLKGRMKIYGCVLSVMLFGHLLFDMVGDSELLLFFPFSRTACVIPQSWGIVLTPTSYLVDNFGIAITIYFIAVFMAVLALREYGRIPR
jgi:hypothetical protein